MRGSSSPHRVAQGGHTSQSQTWDNEDLKIRHMEVSDPERGVLATFVRSGPFPRRSLFPEGLLKGSGSTASTIFSHRRFPRTRHSGSSDMKRERPPVAVRLSLDLFDDAWTSMDMEPPIEKIDGSIRVCTRQRPDRTGQTRPKCISNWSAWIDAGMDLASRPKGSWALDQNGSARSPSAAQVLRRVQELS